MKPLSEWATDELRECIYSGHEDRSEMVDELLRRERERCAAECDRAATAAARECAIQIRRLS